MKDKRKVATLPPSISGPGVVQFVTLPGRTFPILEKSYLGPRTIEWTIEAPE